MEKEKLGIKNVTVRMVCSLKMWSMAKNGVVISCTVMAYLGTMEEILQISEYTHPAAWLDIKVTEANSCWHR
jgi:hypothetical protein